MGLQLRGSKSQPPTEPKFPGGYVEIGTTLKEVLLA